MKTKNSIAIILSILILLIPITVNAQTPELKLWVNGNYVVSDVTPFIDNGRTLVPVRIISETLAFNVDWISAEQKVIISVGDNILTLTINDTKALLGENELFLDAAPQIKNGRTFVPLRFIAEAFNLRVDWDNANSTAIIGDGYIPPVAATPVYRNGLTVSPYPDRQIKGNINSKGVKIYHCPGQHDYIKTEIDESKGERWFATEEATSAGWRRAQQ